MPLATDFGGFGAIGVPLFNNPGTGNTQQWPGITHQFVGPYAKPISSDFDLSTFTSRTIVDAVDRMVITTPNNLTSVAPMLKPIVGTPYTIDLIGAIHNITSSNDGFMLGICLTDSGAGPLMTTNCIYPINATTGGIGGQSSLAQHRTSPSVNSANVRFTSAPFDCGFVCLRFTDDGTTRSFYMSSTGKDWALLASEATNTFVTPTKYGICTYNSNTSFPSIASVYHFKLTSGLLGNAP